MTGDEQCDDGNHESGDGCSSLCRLEEGYVQVNCKTIREMPSLVSQLSLENRQLTKDLGQVF